MLDNLEEFEERISRIENCMIDLGFVLRSFKSDKDFMKLKREFEKEHSSVHGSGESRAAQRGALGKDAQSVSRNAKKYSGVEFVEH
jgi:hypothetical protein